MHSDDKNKLCRCLVQDSKLIISKLQAHFMIQMLLAVHKMLQGSSSEMTQGASLALKHWWDSEEQAISEMVQASVLRRGIWFPSSASFSSCRVLQVPWSIEWNQKHLLFVTCEYVRQEEDAQNIQICLRNRQSPRRRLQPVASSTESLLWSFFLLLIRGLRILHLFPHKILDSSTECSSGPRVRAQNTRVENFLVCVCVSFFLFLSSCLLCSSAPANREQIRRIGIANVRQNSSHCCCASLHHHIRKPFCCCREVILASELLLAWWYSCVLRIRACSSSCRCSVLVVKLDLVKDLFPLCKKQISWEKQRSRELFSFFDLPAVFCEVVAFARVSFPIWKPSSSSFAVRSKLFGESRRIGLKVIGT